MTSPWIKDNAIVVDGTGVVLCDDCPCDEAGGGCACETVECALPVTEGVISPCVTFDLIVPPVPDDVCEGEVTGGLACVCSPWGGTFTLELVDPSPHDPPYCIWSVETASECCLFDLFSGCDVADGACQWFFFMESVPGHGLVGSVAAFSGSVEVARYGGVGFGGEDVPGPTVGGLPCSVEYTLNLGSSSDCEWPSSVVVSVPA